MPSFDVVSEINMHELTNAVDQANRELATRFDFRGVDAKFEVKDGIITTYANAEFQLNQMEDILRSKMVKRGVDTGSLEINDPEGAGKQVRQSIKVREGLEAEHTRKIVKLIKDSKVKVQAAVQGDKVRVTGKKRDDLQETMALLREANVGMPLQFNNFRD
ncbi:YajQ family cyclic di-GMP-binding protein [Litoribrevibacter albus]|uniref:Nucleotide-binding protein GCM10007876_20400 n=1 Tax=Litoribrevibacter albus TaxID=1473156 RepID=A0AA37SAI5_9GAMM|nr:YajQ family cyclic di-GMP-binding protein [Litoribrevibacter albus]GLQ31561.1 UPF0234 protein [Litoribrevibacter albus]